MNPVVNAALLNTDYCHKHYMLSMVDLFRCTKIPVSISVVSSSNVCISRNLAVRGAQEQKAEFLFFVDNDISCPPFTLDRLYRKAVDLNLDIIGCVYPMISPPHEILIKTEKEKLEEIDEVNAIANGLCLIRMSVFDKLKEPYFIYEPSPDVTGHINVSTEDYQFCYKMKKAGMSVWVDTKLSMLVGHWSGKLGLRWAGQSPSVCEALWQPIGYDLADPSKWI